MRFSDIEFGADEQERILEMSLVQNGGLLKHRDRTSGQKELLPGGCEEWSIICLQVVCKSLRNFGSKVSRTLRD